MCIELIFFVVVFHLDTLKTFIGFRLVSSVFLNAEREVPHTPGPVVPGEGLVTSVKVANR